MEPWHRVPPEHTSVLAELERLEPLHHRYAPDATERDVDAMMAPDFWEVGASGARYDRALVLRTVVGKLGAPEQPLRCEQGQRVPPEHAVVPARARGLRLHDPGLANVACRSLRA